MTTIDDIEHERDRELDLIQKKLNEAKDLINAGATGLDATIRSLRAQRASVAAQAYEAELTDPAMTAALAALKSATAEMNSVAARMVSATTFIANIASLVTAVNKTIAALNGSA